MSNQQNRNDIAKLSDHRKRPINHNLGIIFFSVLLIYLIICIGSCISKKQISGYQVVSGSLSINSIYKGIAIREEEVFYANKAGYVNYYASEGLKAGCGNLVYTLDATGEFSEILNNSENTNFSDSEYQTIKSEIKNFKNQYLTTDFSSVYEFKTDLNSLISRYRSAGIMNQIHSANLVSNGSALDMCRAETSGIIVYSHDEFENLTPDNVNLSDLDFHTYQNTHFTSNMLVASGDPVYKIIKDENWYIAIEIDENMANRLRDETYLQVRFLKTQNVSWASSQIKYTGDGILMLLGFNNSMIQFAQDRFVDVELILDQETGLKIPNSSIEEKEFYLIPAEFITKTGHNENASKDEVTTKQGVLVETYDENGVVSYPFKSIDVYYATDEYYYVDKNVFPAGTYLLRPDYNIYPQEEMDVSHIKESYVIEESSSVGILSNEVNEGDQIIYDEYGEMIVIPEGGNITNKSESSEDTNSTEVETLTQEDSLSPDESTNLETSSDSTSQTTNTYSNKFTVGLTGTLIGVYNMNKGFADFKQITILYQNDEYAIVKPNTTYGLREYDYIVLDASTVTDNDLVY